MVTAMSLLFIIKYITVWKQLTWIFTMKRVF